MSYSTIHDHQSMLFDERRNHYYHHAIEAMVNNNSVVLDLGAGLGLHGLIAARNGARKTYLVEPAAIIEITRQLVKANRLTDVVQCLPEKIESIELPEKVDVIISVFTGNFLLTEDLLPSLFYARDRYLKPGGRLIPNRAIMEVAPVHAPDYYHQHIDKWCNSLYDIDFGRVRNFAVNNLYHDNFAKQKIEFLSEPLAIHELDFMTTTEASCHNTIHVNSRQDGICHGWLGWFKIRLGEQWLSTSAQEPATHWRQVFLPIAEPIEVKKGDPLTLELIRPDFGEWTWTVVHNDKRQRQSTFLSEPITPAILHKKSDAYKPILSNTGQITKNILSQFTGNQSTQAIITQTLNAHRQHLHTLQQAEQWVKKLVEKYSQ